MFRFALVIAASLLGGCYTVKLYDGMDAATDLRRGEVFHDIQTTLFFGLITLDSGVDFSTCQQGVKSITTELGPGGLLVQVFTAGLLAVVDVKVVCSDGIKPRVLEEQAALLAAAEPAPKPEPTPAPAAVVSGPVAAPVCPPAPAPVPVSLVLGGPCVLDGVPPGLAIDTRGHPLTLTGIVSGPVVGAPQENEAAPEPKP